MSGICAASQRVWLSWAGAAGAGPGTSPDPTRPAGPAPPRPSPLAAQVNRKTPRDQVGRIPRADRGERMNRDRAPAGPESSRGQVQRDHTQRAEHTCGIPRLSSTEDQVLVERVGGRVLLPLHIHPAGIGVQSDRFGGDDVPDTGRLRVGRHNRH